MFTLYKGKTPTMTPCISSLTSLVNKNHTIQNDRNKKIQQKMNSTFTLYQFKNMFTDRMKNFISREQCVGWMCIHQETFKP